MMTGSLVERACQRVGDLRDAMEEAFSDRIITGDEITLLLGLAREAEQLADAASLALALSVSMLRNGEQAQRTRRMKAALEEACELDGVKRSMRRRTIRRVIRSGARTGK